MNGLSAEWWLLREPLSGEQPGLKRLIEASWPAVVVLPCSGAASLLIGWLVDPDSDPVVLYGMLFLSRE